MNKENNRSAAGLRRSAIAERLRLRDEWLALKGVDKENTQKTTLIQKPVNVRTHKPSNLNKHPVTRHKPRVTNEALLGVVAYVDVGSEPRALALRAALMALGASVVPAWSPLVTHLIWTQGGSRSVRARGRALACQLVSPLWVEACAAEARRLPERLFPAPARPSDLPSPATLRQLLKKAERENIPLENLLSDSRDSDNERPMRLRISSETENSNELHKKSNKPQESSDTSRDESKDSREKSKLDKVDKSHDESSDKTDTSHTSIDTSLDKSKDKNQRRNESDRSHDQSTDRSLDKSADTSHSPSEVAIRVNTAPRRALPVTPTSPPQAKSRRKLFTHKEPDLTVDAGNDTPTPAKPKTMQFTHRGREELARAERIARKLVTSLHKNTQTHRQCRVQKCQPRIVLTGMSRHERREIFDAVRSLNGKVQSKVNRKTTHVLLGSCKEDVSCNNCNKPEDLLEKMFSQMNVMFGDKELNLSGVQVMCSKHCEGSCVKGREKCSNKGREDGNNSAMCTAEVGDSKPRTVNALLGAARGCRVLYGRWALDSARDGKWLPHFGYEVPHLLKISQKARVERSALGRMRSEYAYDVFNGIKVQIRANAHQKPAIEQLLVLCGAILQDVGCDVTVGNDVGDVNSKWVFDSVAAGRMRTTRRYINKSIPNDIINLTQS